MGLSFANPEFEVLWECFLGSDALSRVRPGLAEGHRSLVVAVSKCTEASETMENTIPFPWRSHLYRFSGIREQ